MCADAGFAFGDDGETEAEDLFLNPVGEDASPEFGFGGELDDHLERR